MKGRRKKRLMFIAFIEITGDVKKVREISERIDDERKQFPDRYPKQPHLDNGSIAQFMLGSNNKAFSLYETDTPEQLYRLAQCYEGEAEVKIVPLFQVGV
jgi:hypothetical protein